MRRIRLRKLAVGLHRWLGVFLCLLFALWFFSGIVMMYWSYPEVTPADRLARSEPLDPSTIRVTPADALSILGESRPPGRITLEILGHRPAYRFQMGGTPRIVYADTGEALGNLSFAGALRIASAWTGQPESAARFEGSLNDDDQWTVSGAFRALRPLLRYSWPDGENVYVSAVSGQVEQYTTRSARLASYFGAIPHWLYFTPLRRHAAAWRQAVIWSSGVATAAAILGLIVGTWISVPAKRIPYIGMKRWHTLLGLFFGVIATTWTFSGMLSMDPFPLEGEDENGPAIASALRGARLTPGALRSMDPRQALARIGTNLSVKQLELTTFGGEPVWIARESLQRSRLVAVNGNPVVEFDHQRILGMVAQAVEPARIAESRLVTRYEAYYLDRQHQLPLPVLSVRLNDQQASLYYIDPRTAHVVAGYGRGSRWNRWLYHGLHSLDFPWLYRYRPAWDIVVLLFLAGGSALCVTSVVLATHFLKRKIL